MAKNGIGGKQKWDLPVRNVEEHGVSILSLEGFVQVAKHPGNVMLVSYETTRLEM